MDDRINFETDKIKEYDRGILGILGGLFGRKSNNNGSKPKSKPYVKSNFCTQCGSKLGPDDKFCTKCGKRIE